MRILDRYILKPVLLTFFGCLLVFIFLYIISDILSHLDDLLRNHTGIIVLYQYYLTNLPIIFAQTSPMAILLATIYNFGKLNRTNELIAMRSSGLSLWQLITPVLIIGILLSFTVFLANEKLIPQAQAKVESLKTKIKGEKNARPKEQVIHNLTFYGLGNKLFFVNSFDTKNNIMEGISILEHDPIQNLVSKITARRGDYRDGLWTFYEYSRYNFDSSGQITEDSEYFPEQIMYITETPNDFLQQRKRMEFMSILQLEDYIWRLRKSGAVSALRNLAVELYSRYASSLTGLILVLIGMPFSFVIKKRDNIFSSFGICIGISFLYYVLNAVSLSMGKNGLIPPMLAVWAVPIIFISLAIRSISKIR